MSEHFVYSCLNAFFSYVIEYSEDELRDFLSRNRHNSSGVHEVILDHAIRVFRRFMGDPNVKWALEDDAESRLRSSRGHKRGSERDNESFRPDNISVSSAGVTSRAKGEGRLDFWM